jgi:D-aminoacyl-tRNA deacylase
MRAVIQKVEKADLTVDNQHHASIRHGLVVLLGIEDADNEEDIQWLAGKISRLRVFNDDNDVMNLSVMDAGGELMVISQFTLHASTKKGNRPSYIRAAKPAHAIPVYESFIRKIEKESGCNVISGVFGAYMKVGLVNDGPVTIIIDTKNKE